MENHHPNNPTSDSASGDRRSVSSSSRENFKLRSINAQKMMKRYREACVRVAARDGMTGNKRNVTGVSAFAHSTPYARRTPIHQDPDSVVDVVAAEQQAATSSRLNQEMDRMMENGTQALRQAEFGSAGAMELYRLAVVVEEFKRRGAQQPRGIWSPLLTFAGGPNLAAREFAWGSGREPTTLEEIMCKHINTLLRMQLPSVQVDLQNNPVAGRRVRLEARRPARSTSNDENRSLRNVASSSKKNLKRVKFADETATASSSQITPAKPLQAVNINNGANIFKLRKRTSSVQIRAGTYPRHSKQTVLVGWVGAYKRNPTPMVIDSGSDITLISEGLWRSLRPLPKLNEGEVIDLIGITPKGADEGAKENHDNAGQGCGSSSKGEPLSWFIHLPIFFDTDDGPVHMDVEAYVVKDMTTPFILGNDFAGQYRLSIIRDGRGQTCIEFGGTGRRAAVGKTHSSVA